MIAEFEPINLPNLKEICIGRLESLILSGEWKPGERLPSERDLAARLAISRPVLHEALVDLAARGLVQILPRRGVYVNDFRTHGSVALLESLLAYNQGRLDPGLLEDLLAMRVLLETETSRLAALHRTDDHLLRFRRILEQEADSTRLAVDALTELDFSFHLLVALASGNLVYPMIINSFKSVYTSITQAFFTQYRGRQVVDQVFQFHDQLVNAIGQQDETFARSTMYEMLKHGESYLKGAGNDL